jgi:CubicO group peptidase (beta-lactamase class C family)
MLDAYSDQELRFDRAFGVLEKAIQERVFPGASVAIAQDGKLLALKAVGRFTYDPADSLVSPGTIFDLASVTKVVATTAMAMLLYQRGQLDLDQHVAAVIPDFADVKDAGFKDSEEARRRKRVTLRMLLLHSSGLPAYERLFERADNREELLRLAMRVPLTAEPGTRVEYSDIGFIVLGEVLEQLAGEGLKSFTKREIFGPLGMTSTYFTPPAALRAEIPPTVEDVTFRHRVVQGEVHDENAWVMGGVSGHAGLFSTARDVARLAEAVLGAEYGFQPPSFNPTIFHPETVRLFTQEVEIGGGRHALGWDVPTPPSQAGRRLSAPGCHAFGHLGYTGTSLWIDPGRKLSITLLTNRTWPRRESQGIKIVRPEFHDEVVETFP